MAKNITIVGYGTMGKAIADKLSKKQQTKIWAIDRAHIGFPEKSDFVILAVKPQNLQEVALQIKDKIGKKSIVISILAGVKIKTIENALETKRVVRMMPNLGLSVGAGIAVWKENDGCFTPSEGKEIKKILDVICENIEVPDEKMIDSATAISGSGPAYFFLLADAMLKSAKLLGLNDETSAKLVQRTFKSAALLSENKNYKDLIEKIASKKGTTEAALDEFKKGNFEKLVGTAVKAAKRRAEELSKE